jgi:hypothetical protein
VLAGQNVQPHKIAVTEYPLSKSVRMGKWRLVYYPPGFFRGFARDDWGELVRPGVRPVGDAEPVLRRAIRRPVVRQIERKLLDWLCTTNRPTTAYTPVPKIGGDGKITADDIWAGTPCAPYL